jgi:phosphoglycolate phosphatase
MRYRTLLFDLDGTLIDHFKAIHRSHAHTLRRLGRPEPTMIEVRAAVGAGIEVALARLAGVERVQEALPIYQAYWDATLLDDVELMPGAKELLERARRAGLTSAVLTNKHGPSSRRVCAHLGLTPELAGVFGAGDTPWLKPDPQFTRHVLAELKATSADTCLVGDSPYDLAAARNAGLDFIGVATGTHTAVQLREAGATVVGRSLSEVGSLLLAG